MVQVNKVVLGCRVKANSPHMGSGSAVGVPSLGIFLRDPSPYLCEFRRKPRIAPNMSRSTSATGD